MPRACPRAHVPANIDVTLTRLGIPHAQARAILNVLLGPPTINIKTSRAQTAIARFHEKLSRPDVRGHIHYQGVWPPDRSLPIIQISGERWDAVSLMRELLNMADDEDDFVRKGGWSWVRQCGMHDCVEPTHYTRSTSSRQVEHKDGVWGLLFDSLNPRSFVTGARPRKWFYDDDKLGWNVAACVYGHTVNLTPGRRVGYCPGCRKAETEWTRTRQHFLDRIRAYGPTPDEEAARRAFMAEQARLAREEVRTARERALAYEQDAEPAPSPEPATWDGPTLSDMILAEQEANS